MLVADILRAIDYLNKDHAEQEQLVKKASTPTPLFPSFGWQACTRVCVC